MIGATNDEMRAHLSAFTELRCDERHVWFADPRAPSITIPLHGAEPHAWLHLARLLASLGNEEIHFAHGYLWITTWGVWNSYEEAVAFKIVEQFRRSYGENRSIEAAPGTYFRHDEFVESVSCLLQPMLIGWDAYYVPIWAYGSIDYFVSVSHDGFVDVEVRTPEMHKKAAEILAERDWIKPLTK